MADSIKSLLLQQAAELVYSTSRIASVYLNPATYADFQNAPRPCCVIADLPESPKTQNEVRISKFTLRLGIFIRSNPTFQDNGQGIFVSRAALDLDAIWAAMNGVFLAPGNALFQYARHIEEKSVAKELGYDDNSILVNEYEITYMTVRTNPYYLIDGLNRPTAPLPVVRYTADGGSATGSGTMDANGGGA